MGQPYSLKTALIAATTILATLTIAKHLAAIGVSGTLVYTIAAAVQLYLPILITRKNENQYEELGLTSKGLADELKIVLLLCLIIFPFYTIGHHYFQTLWMGQLWHPASFGNVFDMANVVLTQFVAVALPEELFYRGYLQLALERKWPAKHRLAGVPFGWAIILTSFIFALGHFLGEYNIIRLGPFFPALLFSWLRGRKGSIWGAVTFHALCNIYSGFLFKFYGG